MGCFSHVSRLQIYAQAQHGEDRGAALLVGGRLSLFRIQPHIFPPSESIKIVRGPRVAAGPHTGCPPSAAVCSRPALSVAGRADVSGSNRPKPDRVERRVHSTPVRPPTCVSPRGRASPHVCRPQPSASRRRCSRPKVGAQRKNDPFRPAMDLIKFPLKSSGKSSRAMADLHQPPPFRATAAVCRRGLRSVAERIRTAKN